MPTHALVDEDGKVVDSLSSVLPLRIPEGLRLSLKDMGMVPAGVSYDRIIRLAIAGAEGRLECYLVSGELRYDIFVVGTDPRAVEGVRLALMEYVGMVDISPALPGLPELEGRLARLRYLLRWLWHGTR